MAIPTEIYLSFYRLWVQQFCGGRHVCKLFPTWYLLFCWHVVDIVTKIVYNTIQAHGRNIITSQSKKAHAIREVNVHHLFMSQFDMRCRNSYTYCTVRIYRYMNKRTRSSLSEHLYFRSQEYAGFRCEYAVLHGFYMGLSRKLLSFMYGNGVFPRIF